MKRVVLVTGVAGGIGKATAELFSSQGWYVIGIDRQPDDGKNSVDLYLTVDVSDQKKVTKAIDQVKQSTNRLDALVNNAAMQICKPIVEMEVSEWDQIMAVNLRSAFLFSKLAYELLEASEGNIVNVSSVHAVATSANIAAYAASKGALMAFTRALAIEFASAGIRVNAILPGAVDTPMLRAGLNRGHVQGKDMEERVQALGAKHIVGRVGKPQEIADIILFLAQKSLFITGQGFIIDGGATARLSTE